MPIRWHHCRLLVQSWSSQSALYKWYNLDKIATESFFGGNWGSCGRVTGIFFSFILFPLLCGVDVRRHTPPCSSVIHIISRQSLLFDVILHFVQPSSLRSSSLPSPLYFHYHCPPSCVVFLSSHHMPVPLQPSFL